MDPVIWEADPPQLRSPILVCAFAGWNDAASAASAALEAVAASLDGDVVARICETILIQVGQSRPGCFMVADPGGKL